MSTEFNDRIDSLFTRLEDAIDASELDLDYENQGGVFTVSMDDAAPLILNRHSPTQQLWLATREGGYHMEYDPARQEWFCTRSGDSFRSLWGRACLAQYGAQVDYA